LAGSGRRLLLLASAAEAAVAAAVAAGAAVHRVSKNCPKLFLSELCQIFTNCENVWHKDGKEDKLM